MRLIKKLEKTCDQIICKDNLLKLQKYVVIVAIIAFITNLALIFLANHIGTTNNFWESIGTNYFASIFTPFGIILFYEVIVLIFALPKASSRSVARQFEIISLIILFRVFKDVSEVENLAEIVNDADFIKNVGIDMVGSLIMFALIALFYLTIRFQEKIENLPDDSRNAGLTTKKKVITVIVAAVISIVGMIFFGEWLVDLIGGSYRSFFTVQRMFFENVFTILIFTDITIVLISYLLNDDYAIDFRNIGFIASTIFLRFSLVAEKPNDIYLAIFAFTFGVLVNTSFNFFIKARNGTNTKEY